MGDLERSKPSSANSTKGQRVMTEKHILLLANPRNSVIRKIDEHTKCKISYLYRNQLFVRDKDNLKDVEHDTARGQQDFDNNYAKRLILNYKSCLTRWNKEFMKEENISYIILAILKIYTFLKKEQCTAAIFFTASPHHLGTIMVDIACTMANVKRTFLYPAVFNKKVLPITKQKDYASSIYEYSNTKISKHKARSDIQDFLENANRKELPLTNQKIRSNIINTIPFMIKEIGITLMKKIVRLSRDQKTNRGINSKYILQPDLIEASERKNIIKTLILISKQIKYNKYMSRLIKENKRILDNIKSNNFMLCIYPGIEPEATTTPEGGIYESIAALATDLRLKFPNIPILYKEHPNVISYILDNNLSSAGAYRNMNFLRLLEELNIIVVDNLIIENNMAEKNIIPVTLTGTIAIERSLQGKKTIVAGIPYYGAMPGTYKLNNLNLNDLLEAGKEEQIAIKAFKYLENLLDGKMIDNPFGIGSNYVTLSSCECIQEYKELIESL